ncbi:M15 family metallopeptidase [Celerinatantimonas sp. YJH-8]|uniref:M15 family metallopeptidase n=1 Tax=Celerinatantimonas sp. YJH-8 TaxID=3228714 RepID=UPI0038C082D5
MSYPLLYGQQFFPLTEVESGQRLHPQAAAAFLQMQQAAAAEGIQLSLYSSYRSFNTQLTIWNEKWSGQRAIMDDNNRPIAIHSLTEIQKLKAILRWSALPGASRHHWGTDIDIYSLPLIEGRFELCPATYQPGGMLYPLWQWLSTHAQQFHFFFPYCRDLGGTHPEPWHLSYAPLAQKFKSEHQLTSLTTLLEQSEIKGKNTVLKHLSDIYHDYFIQICEPL